MCKQKVPEELLRQAREVQEDIAGFELVDRYVLKQLVEAGSRDQVVDERLVRAGQEIIHNMHHPPSRKTRPGVKTNSKQTHKTRRYSIARQVEHLISVAN